MIKFGIDMKKCNFLQKRYKALIGLIFGLVFILNAAFSSMMMQSPLIESPKAGDVIQGIVSIKGSLNLSNYDSYEVSFAYNEDNTETWFLILKTDEKIKNRELAVWDTSEISDGDYKIQVKVITTSDTMRITIVEDLYVRNYTQFEDEIDDTQYDSIGLSQTPKITHTISTTLEPNQTTKNELAFPSVNIVNVMKYTIIVVVVIFIGGLLYLNAKKK